MIKIIEQGVLRADRALVPPWDDVNDLVKDLERNKPKRPLLVLESDMTVLDGVRRLKAMEIIKYTGPVPCQVIGYGQRGVEDLLKYMEEAREAEGGPMPFHRLYDIYNSVRDLARDIRRINRANGLKGLSFLDSYSLAAGYKPWKFGDYHTFRTRTLGLEEDKDVKRYNELINRGEITAITATMRLARLGVIDGNTSDGSALLPTTPSTLTPKQQLKVLENMAHQVDGIRSGMVGLGRIDRSISSSTHPEIRKSLAETRRALSLLIKVLDEYGRDQT